MNENNPNTKIQRTRNTAPLNSTFGGKKKKILILLLLVLAGCAHQPVAQPPIIETLRGIVMEKRANVKSYESWNSPSDPYYVLDMGGVTERYSDGTNTWQETKKRHVTLRPSDLVTTEDLSKFKNKQVVIIGRYTEGKPYKPTHPDESYPIVPQIITAPDGSIKPGPMRPANLGAGFVVQSIREQGD
jgi:hypothetical protein